MCVTSDVVQQDSGNYTCEVRGPQSVVLGHVTHFILVRGAVASNCRLTVRLRAYVVSCIVSRGFCPHMSEKLNILNHGIIISAK